jgi:hypothetical protein
LKHKLGSASCGWCFFAKIGGKFARKKLPKSEKINRELNSTKKKNNNLGKVIKAQKENEEKKWIFLRFRKA